MAEYEVKSANTRKFSLFTNDKKIGDLEYENWFSFKAIITLADHSTLQIEPKGFWGTTIELKSHETILASFKMNWNGNIIIQTNFDSDRDFVFKHKGFLKSTYVLLDKEEQELLVIQPDFKWSRLNYDYNISTTDSFEKFNFKNILLLATLHCANYYISTMTSA